MIGKPVFAILGWALLGGWLLANDATSPTVSAPTTPTIEYRVGPGDVLEITVFGNEDLSRTSTVQPNGTIALSLLGDVPVSGLTMLEIQQKLTSLLKQDYLVNPQVDIRVKEYQSQFVSVVGEVNSPGRKPLRGPTRLIDVLVDAGGLTPRASGEITVTRLEGTFVGGSRKMRFHLGQAPSAQDQLNLEVPLQNGDVVTASPKYYVTVEGEVTHPGRYVIEGDLTVTGAISTAGGLTRFGSNDLKVRRINPQTGQTQILKVSMKKIRKGKEPDLALLPNDVVTVSRRLF